MATAAAADAAPPPLGSGAPLGALSALPTALMLRILALLPPPALCAFAACSRAALALSEDSSLWDGRGAGGLDLSARAAALLGRELRLPAQALLPLFSVVRAQRCARAPRPLRCAC